jgi:hypothetical protein
MKPKINIKEELTRMKNLFGYERGRVISEQQVNTTTQPGQLPFPTYQRTTGSAKEDYPSCVQVFGEPGTVTKGKSYYILGTGDWKDYYFYTNNNYGNLKITDRKPPHGSYYCKDNVIVLTPLGITSAEKDVESQKNNTPSASKPNVKSPDKSKPKQTIQKPKELTDVEAFQDWLDENHPGWATGFKDGKLRKGRGYGTFGPRTSAAWGKYKDEYLNKKTTTKTPESSQEEYDAVEEVPAETNTTTNVEKQAQSTMQFNKPSDVPSIED